MSKRIHTDAELHPDYIVLAQMIEETMNVVGIKWIRLIKGTENIKAEKNIMMVPYHPNEHPSSFFEKITVILNSCAHTIRTMREDQDPKVSVVVDGGSIKITIENILGRLKSHLEHKIMDAQGRKHLDIDQNGFIWIPEKMPEAVKVAFEEARLARKAAEDEAELSKSSPAVILLTQGDTKRDSGSETPVKPKLILSDSEASEEVVRPALRLLED